MGINKDRIDASWGVVEADVKGEETLTVPKQDDAEILQVKTVEVLRIKAGDMVVLKTDLDAESINTAGAGIHRVLMRRFPGIHVVILAKGQELSVLRKADPEVSNVQD